MYELISAFFPILTSFSLKPLTRNHSYIMVYYVFLIRVCDDHSATWHFYSRYILFFFVGSGQSLTCGLANHSAQIFRLPLESGKSKCLTGTDRTCHIGGAVTQVRFKAIKSHSFQWNDIIQKTTNCPVRTKAWSWQPFLFLIEHKSCGSLFFKILIQNVSISRFYTSFYEKHPRIHVIDFRQLKKRRKT